MDKSRKNICLGNERRDGIEHTPDPPLTITETGRRDIIGKENQRHYIVL
jgi:hypothetical protein